MYVFFQRFGKLTVVFQINFFYDSSKLFSCKSKNLRVLFKDSMLEEFNEKLKTNKTNYRYKKEYSIRYYPCVSAPPHGFLR